ncbi:MAG TPA: hypothetical protein VLA93_20745 [Pyrinomonadaceae bacterium]|nr:hypothetical protein [Pyrinomonadaceae bacterium]
MTVGSADKALLVQATDLVPYGYGFQNIAKHETFKKSRDIDGTVEIEYEFETPDNEVEHSLYLDVVVTISRAKSDARVSSGAEKIGILAGLKFQGIVQEEKPGFYKYGDSSDFFVLKKDGTPIGNYFSVREGTKTYSILLAGMYIEDPDVWKELVEAKLKAMSTYKP